MRSSKYGSTFEVLAVATLVAAVHVDERDVERQRGHRDELLAVVVRRASRCADARVDAHHVGAEPDARREERHPPRRGLQPEQEHALVELGRARPRPTAGRCGSAARAGSSRATRTRRRRAAPCPRAQSRPTSGPPYETIVRSVTGERQQRAHEGHRLAPRSPAADADGHAVAHLGDDVVDGHAFVGNRQRVAPRGRAGF